MQVLEAERHHQILNIVAQRSVVSVAELSGLLAASDATIRRDINALAERGAVKRVRGGAEALQPRHQPRLVGLPSAMSQTTNVLQKRAIARAAAQLITPGESIIINGGTTTFSMVQFLADKTLGNILTNSFVIAAQLLATSRHRITIAGGTIYREQNIIFSPFSDDVLEGFWGHRVFTGCYGVNRFGIMEADPLIVQAHTKLLKRSQNVVVMADSSKLRRRSSMIIAALQSVTTLVTDDGASAEELHAFKAAGVEVIVVTVAEEDQLGQPA
jgi:DeoR family ulaG and ulaABCDEF operon transcriptional repressor